VEAGKRIDAAADTQVRSMTADEMASLQAEESDLISEARGQQVTALHARAYSGVWVFAFILYLIFVLVLKPAPPSFIFDVMSARAQAIAVKHAVQRTAADSPQSAALAQMYVRAGNIDAARAEIQSIIHNDPNSEYGQWAERYWMEFERMRNKSGRGPKRGRGGRGLS
jgi:hypothetical protein